MSVVRNWLIIFLIGAACTCGGRTECNVTNTGQISFLTGVHGDGACKKISNRGVLLYEASQLIVEQYNSKTTGFKLDIDVFDTCGSIGGALKAAMKALVSADLTCLQPPNYLGIIGPDNPTNVEAVQKVTSVLRVPHLVRKPSTSAFLHHLAMESNSYVVQGIMKVIEKLKWKTFTLIAKADEDGNDDVQNLARKLTIEAIAKKLCVIVRDDDDGDYTKNIIHIGKPDSSFFGGPVNSTILIVSEGSLEDELNRINSSNMILLLEDDRNELDELQARVEKSKWWNGDQLGKYDPEELREVRWLQESIKSFGTALDSICKKKKCKSPINSSDWNEMVSKVLASRNEQLSDDPRGLNLLAKIGTSGIETVGKISVKKNVAKISWEIGKKEKKKSKKAKEDGDEEEEDEEDEDEEGEELPDGVKKIIGKSKNEETTTSGCVSGLLEAKLTKKQEEPVTHVVVSEMDDTEWWTMVATVSGVGVAMFVIGILAVYIVYTNIRGPRSPKGQPSSGRRYSVENDTSLRRVGSDREMPISGGGGGGGRNQRQAPRSPPPRSLHRRDSIRSNISDRSV